MRTWAEIKRDELINSEILQTIVFKLVVPTEQEVKEGGKALDLSKSDLNACYCKPIVNPWSEKSQSWYDVKLTVQGDHDLPTEKEWFYVTTELGKYFKAHFVGKKTKKLVAICDPRILGFITKGALVDREVIWNNIDFTKEDPERRGIITQEVLEEYGGSEVFLKKTNKTKQDRRGKKRDIWIISFPHKPWKPSEEWYRLVNEIAQRVNKEKIFK